MKKYIQTDELQKLIDWQKIMPMSRCAGGHDEQMGGLFKNIEVIAHWNDDDYQGMVATCVKFTEGNLRVIMLSTTITMVHVQDVMLGKMQVMKM